MAVLHWQRTTKNANYLKNRTMYGSEEIVQIHVQQSRKKPEKSESL